VQVTNSDSDNQSMTCVLDANYSAAAPQGAIDEVVDGAFPGSPAGTLGIRNGRASAQVWALQGTFDFLSTGYATVVCNTYNGGADARMSAIEVGGVG
jgi:hypothetical protein